jgi:hypothetical protein
MNDLVVLVPDKNMESGINSLLSRYGDLGIRQISYKIIRHPNRDPGVYNDPVELLRPFINQYRYTFAFIDHEGSGREKETPEKITEYIKSRLYGNGWKNKSEVIVFVPELEIWLWANSQYTAEALGWQNYSELKNWLMTNGFWEENSPKPPRPKEALEKALREKHIPRSSSIYGEIADKINFHRCQDPAFMKFREVLKKWFCESA